METKYPVGTEVYSMETEYHGVVIPNCKMPGDICVKWETGQVISYDKEWLDENTEIISDL